MIQMTWREVKAALDELDEEELDMSACILDAFSREVTPITECFLVGELPSSYQDELDGVIESDQPVIVIGQLEPDDVEDES